MSICPIGIDYSCDECRMCGRWKRRYKSTNADKIRSMSDEELAEFLVSFKNTFGEEYEGVMSCLDWLREPVE